MSQAISTRQIALPINNLNDQSRLGTLLVGRSFSDFAAYLDMIQWIILLSLPITMGLIAVASWWLAGGGFKAGAGVVPKKFSSLLPMRLTNCARRWPLPRRQLSRCCDCRIFLTTKRGKPYR